MPPSAITVNIANTTVTPTVANVDTFAILSYNMTGAARSKTYNSLVAVQADFAATGPEVAYATGYFGQPTPPAALKILQGLLKPTLQYTIGQSALRNSDATSYAIAVSGFGMTPVTKSYTTDASASAAEIHNGLVTALNTVANKNFTATFAPFAFPGGVDFTFTCDHTVPALTKVAHGLNTGDGAVRTSNSGGALPAGLAAATDYYAIRLTADTFLLASSLANALAGVAIALTGDGTGTQTLNHQAGTLSPTLPFLVTGNAAGNWFSLSVADVTALSIAMTHADAGVATDLAACRLADTAWFDLDTVYNSKAVVLAAAAWAEATPGVGYTPQICDSATVTTAQGNGDTIDTLATDNYDHTSPYYYPVPGTPLTAAANGNVLPRRVSATWDAKPLVGIPAVPFTDTQYANLVAKRGNSIRLDSGLTITFSGICSSGRYFDQFRGQTWWASDLKATLTAINVASDGIPYEDEGISAIKGGCRSSTKRAIALLVVAADPAPVFTFPKAADVSPSDKAARQLIVPNAIQATAAGNIQTITVDVNIGA